ncbi:MAG: hypothetical protein AB7E55_29400 [Pigmentiphaga sp.]
MSGFDNSVAEYYISDGDGREVCIDLVAGGGGLVPTSWRAIVSLPMTLDDGAMRKQAVLHVGGESDLQAFESGCTAARHLLADPTIWRKSP